MLTPPPVIAVNIFFSILGAIILLALVQSVWRMLRYPDQQLEYEQVPEEIRQTLDSLTQSLRIGSTLVSYHSKDLPSKYHLKGFSAGKELEIEVELNQNGSKVREIEIEYETDPEYRRFENLTECSHDLIPSDVEHTITELLAVLGSSPQTTRVPAGFNSRSASFRCGRANRFVGVRTQNFINRSVARTRIRRLVEFVQDATGQPKTVTAIDLTPLV